jgi:hypothetical protein
MASPQGPLRRASDAATPSSPWRARLQGNASHAPAPPPPPCKRMYRTAPPAACVVMHRAHGQAAARPTSNAAASIYPVRVWTKQPFHPTGQPWLTKAGHPPAALACRRARPLLLCLLLRTAPPRRSDQRPLFTIAHVPACCCCLVLRTSERPPSHKHSHRGCGRARAERTAVLRGICGVSIMPAPTARTFCDCFTPSISSRSEQLIVPTAS